MDDNDLQLAKQVHYSLLPDDYSDKRVDISAKILPCNTLGGDFCSVLPIDDKKVIVCICDAVGHGIASALYAARVNSFVLLRAKQHLSPDTLIKDLNEFLYLNFRNTGIYATFFSLFINYETSEISYTNAGQTPAIHYSRTSNKVTLLHPQTSLLGFTQKLDNEGLIHHQKFEQGDKLFLYTDGLLEIVNEREHIADTSALEDFLIRNHNNNSSLFNQSLLNDYVLTDEKALPDDILILTITFK